jgi:CheY-like chemotaxis protein
MILEMRHTSILCVDDHHLIRDALKELLSPQYRVRVAGTAKEALLRIEEEMPDLVISGVVMPEVDGFAFLQALQSNPRTRAIPFVFLTSADHEENREYALTNGADDFISKQKMSQNYLLLRIDRLLERIAIFRGGSPHKSTTEVLKVFISYAREDELSARRIRKFLIRNGVTAWLDAEDLIPGQEWEAEIRRALRGSHLVLVCLSNKSITKRGYVQKEIRLALDLADEEPHGSIFAVPLRLEECAVPEPLTKWQWLDFFKSDSEAKLLNALRIRAETLGVLPPSGPLVTSAGINANWSMDER